MPHPTGHKCHVTKGYDQKACKTSISKQGALLFETETDITSTLSLVSVSVTPIESRVCIWKTASSEFLVSWQRRNVRGKVQSLKAALLWVHGIKHAYQHTTHSLLKKCWQYRRRAEHVPNKVMEKVKELQQWKLFEFHIQCRGRFVWHIF